MKKSVENFVDECPVCQRAKVEHYQYPGFLAPLPIPQLAWTFISMDFIEGMPKSANKNSILVLMDKLTKYYHFISLLHPFTAQVVAQLFIDNIFKLHRSPVAIVTDTDPIFISKIWQEIFKSMKITLQYNTTYHLQMDGQTERA
jgi:hypothetical protein